jgi:hypothetical protein
MTTRYVFFMRNVSSPTSDFDQGPFRISADTKLLSVKMSGSFVDGYSTVTVTGQKISNDEMWGLQSGPTGYTSKNIISDADNPAWWQIEQLNWGTVFDTFDNAISSIELGTAIPVRYQWRGQLPIPGGQDFYVSFGNAFSTGAGGAISGMLELITT